MKVGEVRYKGQRQRVWLKGWKRTEEDDQADICNIIQKKTNTGVHLKIDKAMEGRTRK